MKKKPKKSEVSEKLSKDLDLLMKRKSEKPKKPVRMCFKQDDDSHWYLIPVSEKERFEKLLSEGEKDDWDSFNEAFDQMRCNGPHITSFLDPQEDI